MGRDRAILLTAPASAAIAVVRLVGPAVLEFLKGHFSKAPARGRCVHGELRDGQQIIDDAVVVLSDDGRFADVNVHGGPWLVRTVLELAGRSGFQIIDRPGIPLDVDAADGQTIIEREVAAHLPLARTELALRILLAQSQTWRRFCDSSPSREQISSILKERSLHWLLYPPRIAIVGTPNVGKSTLANQLFAQERSITADLPGTTRDWVGEIANIDGLAVMLVDTPGHRETTDPIEHASISRSLDVIRRADLAIVVLDATQSIESQQPLLHQHPDAMVVLNKTDLACPSVRGTTPLPTIATTGQGLDALRLGIRRRFGCGALSPDVPRCWTDRQRQVLSRRLVDPLALAEISVG